MTSIVLLIVLGWVVAVFGGMLMVTVVIAEEDGPSKQTRGEWACTAVLLLSIALIGVAMLKVDEYRNERPPHVTQETDPAESP